MNIVKNIYIALLIFTTLFLITICPYSRIQLNSAIDTDNVNSLSTLPIIDTYGRELILQGLNSSNTSKDADMRRSWETEADVQRQAQVLGYNTARYLIFWDYLMPEPGKINQTYLDDIESRLKWYSDNHMKVILDMHQDNWSKSCGGNGAPDWASFSSDETVSEDGPWWLKAASPCVVNSFNAFWGNSNNLQEYYAQAWTAVAERFKNNTAVIGYDLMNEPTQTAAIVDQVVNEMLPESDKNLLNFAVRLTIWSGGEPWNPLTDLIKQKIRDLASSNGYTVPESYIWMITKTIISRNYGDWGLLNAVKEYENDTLSNFYQLVINSIRKVDTNHYIFVEPFSVGVNNGNATYLSRLNDPVPQRRLGYIPHLYPRNLHEGGAYTKDDFSIVTAWENNQRKFAHDNDLILLLGEFGLSNTVSGGVQYLKDVVNMLERNHLSWFYWSSDPGSWGPLDINKTSELPNAEALVNIYPRAVAGKIINYDFNLDTKTFILNYRSNEASGKTEIALPKRFFPNGFKVTSSDPENTWDYSFDNIANIVYINHNSEVSEHQIIINPTN
jgi:hypothetical protein